MSEGPVEEVDEPTDETVSPDEGRDLVEGVGFHDTEATVLDTEEPDIETDEEPNVDEPSEEEEAANG